MLHEILWKANSDLTGQILAHPFVCGLADNSLDRDAFRRYVAQDAFFLRSFLKAYAVGAAKCDDMKQTRIFYELMGGVFDELHLHESYAASLEVDLVDVQPYPATLAYTDFLTRIAWEGTLPEILAAMVPCMRLYHHLGVELAKSPRKVAVDADPYGQWIHTYADDDFAQLCQRLEQLLDQVASDTASVRDAYRYAMQCELDFFSAPLQAVVQ